jgi:hypothetical protein
MFAAHSVGVSLLTYIRPVGLQDLTEVSLDYSKMAWPLRNQPCAAQITYRTSKPGAAHNRIALVARDQVHEIPYRLTHKTEGPCFSFATNLWCLIFPGEATRRKTCAGPPTQDFHIHLNIGRGHDHAKSQSYRNRSVGNGNSTRGDN